MRASLTEKGGAESIAALSTLVGECNQKMKPKILIVDDDVAITQQLFWTLCDEYEVITANDMSTAIRRAVIYEPPVIVLDLHLPPTLDAPDSGMSVLRYIRDNFAASKVFMTSSAATAEMQRACLEGGAEGFFSKPLDIENLLASVRRAVLARYVAAA